MNRQPTLETGRLVLRPFEMSDAPEVRRLAGDSEVAGNALNIPEPFEAGMAEAWIATHADFPPARDASQGRHVRVQESSGGQEVVRRQPDLRGQQFGPGAVVLAVRHRADAQVIEDRDTGRSKGFGFVEMDSEAQAQAAIDGLNDQEHDGRRLTVNEAKPREDRGGGGGYGGGRGRGGGGYGGGGYGGGGGRY